MPVVFVSSSETQSPLADVEIVQIRGWLSRRRARRLKPGAVICATPAAQLPGRWPQIGLCDTPADAVRYHHATNLVVATEACARHLAAAGRKSVVLPLPTPDVFAPVPSALNLLVTARLARASHLDLLLKSVAGLKLTITLAGTGPAQPGLADLARRLALNVTFYPHPTAALYQRATLIVHPVAADLAGTAIRAAHAAGRPLIATATEAARELIIPNETGILIPPGDVEALAHSIRIMLDNPEMAAAIAAASHDFYLTHASEPLLQGRWRRYLAALIEKEPPDARNL